MKFYDAVKPLYLKTDASGVGLGTRVVQVRESMNHRHDKISDYAILLPTAFTSKGLSNME